MPKYLGPLRKRLYVIALVFAPSVLTLKAQPDFGMKMHVINIGQGESILLEFRSHAVLVDTGAEDTEDDDRYKVFLAKYLDDFFQRRTELNRTLHGVVLSHPHVDHS